MDLAAAGLTEQPFPTHGHAIVTVPYASHRSALKALQHVCAAPNGMALLQGPALAGKSTTVRRFVETLDAGCAVALVDGSGLNTSQLLEGILRQFGYELDYNSPNELFGMLRVFALQQAARYEAPLLIIENAHALKASALHTLCELAELDVRQATAIRTSAIKMVLVSDKALTAMADDDLLQPILSRVSADVHMRPMSVTESAQYLQLKLRRAGSALPDYVFPPSVCEALHHASGGWPGILDRIALLALARARTLPVTADMIEQPVLPRGTWEGEISESVELAPGTAPEPPRLIVSKGGKPVQAMTFDQARLLIGRSDHNDIPIQSKFVSRHHLLLVRNGGSTFLMDLNSTNGTLVNSRRVSNHVLMHNDIISIGQHRIKFHDPYATTRGSMDGIDFADTAIMKTLEDMRKLLAQENTEILPAASSSQPR